MLPARCFRLATCPCGHFLREEQGQVISHLGGCGEKVMSVWGAKWCIQSSRRESRRVSRGVEQECGVGLTVFLELRLHTEVDSTSRAVCISPAPSAWRDSKLDLPRWSLAQTEPWGPESWGSLWGKEHNGGSWNLGQWGGWQEGWWTVGAVCSHIVQKTHCVHWSQTAWIRNSSWPLLAG